MLEVVGLRTGKDVEVSVRMCDKCSLVGRQLWYGVDCLTRGVPFVQCWSTGHLKCSVLISPLFIHFTDEGSWVRSGERIKPKSYDFKQ